MARDHRFAPALCIAIAVTSAHAQTISFAAARSFPAGTSPTSVATGTFKTAGVFDLAIANQHGVAVLLNDQSGGYLPRADYNLPAGSNAQSVVAFQQAAGDFHQAIAVVSQGAGSVTILLNNGDGTFHIGQTYAVGVNPRMVITNDFNHDGAPDLAVVDSGAGPGTSGVSILLGNHDGTFQAAKFTATGSVSLSLFAEDFDADSNPDLAVANSGSDDLTVLFGKGDGTFRPATTYKLDRPGISVSPTSVVAGDFNGDGHWDLAVATPDIKGYAVLLGTVSAGTVGFGAPAYYTLDDPNFVNNKDFLAVSPLVTVSHPHQDLILAGLSADHVTVLFGAGDGTFPSSASYAAGPSPTTLAFLANSNGSTSVAVSNFAVDGVVTILPMNANGSLQAAPVYRSAYIPQSLAVGDLNHDGIPDIVAASANVFTGLGSGVSMLGKNDSFVLGKGSGTFQAPVTWTTSVTTAIALGDFNRDGKLDIAATHPSPGNGNISIHLGNGDGTFQAPHTYTAGTTPDTIAVADVNGDGNLDLVVGNGNSANVSVLLGNGDGIFQAASNYATPASGTPDSVVVTDFNGDGKPDIVAAISGINAGMAVVFPGNGNGTFQAAIQIPSAIHSSATLRAAAGDFNKDGKSDLAITDGTTLSILLGNSTGAVPTPILYTLIGPGAGIDGMVATEDFDGDSKPDLVVSTRDGIFLLSGIGDGTFQPPVTYSPFIGGAVAVADLDGNGTPDIVAADSSQDSIPTDTVAVLLNSKVVDQVPLTVTTSPTGLPFSVYYGFTNGNAEFIGCGAGPCTYSAAWGEFFQIYIDATTVSGGPGKQYVWTGFNDGGPTTTGSTGEIIHNVLFPAVASTVTVLFKSQYQLTLAAAPANGGTVTPASGNFYDALSSPSTTAAPNAGYTFVNWTGILQTPGGPVNDVCGVNPCAVPMNGPVTWTANFNFTAQRCDLNADLQLTAADVHSVIRQALGIDPASADLDASGGVSAADVQLLLNAVIGAGTCPSH